MDKNYTDELLHLVEAATSPYHAVYETKKRLKEAGFEELHLKQDWGLNIGGAYYVEGYGSTLVAFRVGGKYNFRNPFRIAAAHTDFPGFCIKQNPEMPAEKYARLNVEVYGGPILNTWLDRPLSAAGRVVLKSENVFKPEIRLIDLKKPLFVIPNLAIHQNREVNKGVELNRQTDMAPVVGMMEDMLNEEQYFLSYLARALNVEMEDILDYEMYIYNCDVGDIIGMNEEFISAPRLDNLTSVEAITTALIKGDNEEVINVGVFFDHEEIGSKTKQGGGSALFSLILEKIMFSMGFDRNKFISTLTESLFVSVDVAHALHPNHVMKSDPVNKALLNKGFCIKEACSQSYATDSEIIGIIQRICEVEEISFQKIANRSDAPSGSTLGSIASTLLPVKTIDIGIPLLAMHSSRELMGRKDQESLVKLLIAFYSL